MRAYLALSLALCILLASVIAACGDGSGSGEADGGATDTNGSESDFETLRDRLIERLDSFGANIGSVPDDIRDQILGTCRELSEFADPEVVDQICRAIQQAIDDSDPGLVDLIVDQLAELEPS